VVAGAGWAVEDEAERRSATRVIADRRRRREHELERLACSGVDCERIADEGLEHGERQVFRRIGGECTHNAYDAGRDGGPTSADHPPLGGQSLVRPADRRWSRLRSLPVPRPKGAPAHLKIAGLACPEGSRSPPRSTSC
jgi:hypothetical protein